MTEVYSILNCALFDAVPRVPEPSSSPGALHERLISPPEEPVNAVSFVIAAGGVLS